MTILSDFLSSDRDNNHIMDRFHKSSSVNISQCPGTFPFEGSDNRALYIKHRKKNLVPAKDCNYTLNSHGYRCPEFEDIKWDESIVAFGCSNTLGIGLDDKETFCNIVQDITKRPVINLGQGATGIWQILYNYRALHRQGHKPYKVILQVPSANRLAVFDKHELLNLGPWATRTSWLDAENKKNYLTFNTNYWNVKVYQTMALELIDAIRPPDCVISFVENSPGEIIHSIDQARDNSHPGPRTAEYVAERILSILS